MAAEHEAPLVPLFDVRLNDDEIGAVERTLRSGWLTMGPQTQTFEAAFAHQLCARHAVALSSCTAALHLAYLAAGVGPGDEVIVPAITFVATANAARYCGATPVLADVIGQHDLGIDPADVEARITKRTRAVCAVHFAGYAAPIEQLRELCDACGLALIEDAAHAPALRLPAAGPSLARSASREPSASSRTRCCPAARVVCSPQTTTTWRSSRAACARTR